MSRLSAFGTARARVLGHAEAELYTDDPEHADVAYLGWEIARAATDLEPADRRALAALTAATLAAARAGSTRLPIDERLASVLEGVGGATEEARARALLRRAAATPVASPLGGVIGVGGARAPLIVDGQWLYAERLRGMDERFCGHVRGRLAQPAESDEKAVRRALKAVSTGPSPLTEEQRKAVHAALVSRLGLVTGGPGTGKTTIVVSLVRALAWTGMPGNAIAIAAPTGKAANRLQQALDEGLAGATGDLADQALRTTAPKARTLHALLGWSPSTGRFARQAGDPLPHRVVIVDEASMVDLALMDRLFLAMRPEARLVLLGDADQLPSVEAGAVFRDLCATLPVSRLTTNLRVTRDPAAQRIVTAAAAVKAGEMDALAGAMTARRSVDELTFEGVEHLDVPWREVAGPFVARWWEERVASLPDFRRRSERTLRLRDGALEPEDAAEGASLLAHHARNRLLCATRLEGVDASTFDLNDRLLTKLRGGLSAPGGRRPGGLVAGAPVMVEHNDHERHLYNGDQGLAMRVDGGSGPPGLATLFRRTQGLEAIPIDLAPAVTPAFAMTVHKSQGSEYEHVAFVLPERDMTMLTRELLYTAITRARRSVLIVGTSEVLARAVSRRVERWTGVAELLAKPAPRLLR